MEEILQSIKRIIAEEGETPSGSDVLELTDLVQDDGSVTKASPSAAESPRIETLSIDEIIAAPVLPEYVPETPKPPPQPKAPAMPKSPADEGLVSAETVSKSTAALEALKKMPAPETPAQAPSGLKFRSGTTIEELVLEGLKPMLKEWLDANLPGMVERLVEREIKKISSR